MGIGVTLYPLFLVAKDVKGRAGGEASQAAARQHSMGEYVLGYVPRRDGSDYSEDALSPRWEDLLNLLEEEEIESADIVVYGKIYKQSNAIGSSAVHMPATEELFGVPDEVTPDEPNVPGSGSFKRGNTGAYVDYLFGWEEGSAQHIVGIVIRKLG